MTFGAFPQPLAPGKAVTVRAHEDARTSARPAEGRAGLRRNVTRMRGVACRAGREGDHRAAGGRRHSASAERGEDGRLLVAHRGEIGRGGQRTVRQAELGAGERRGAGAQRLRQHERQEAGDLLGLRRRVAARPPPRPALLEAILKDAVGETGNCRRREADDDRRDQRELSLAHRAPLSPWNAGGHSSSVRHPGPRPT